MYSGFFQHEIKANLLDAEQIFVAMGYKLMPNQTLVLDGPICPDQVTNVSRDAMAAYIECQIMKRINLELFNNQLPTSWLEIFTFRENYVGDSTSAFKGIAYNIQKRHSMKSVNGKFLQVLFYLFVS